MSWDLVFVLPNLRLRDGDEEAAKLSARLTAKHVALVAPTDPRIAEIRQRSAGADKLLSGFRDMAGSPMQPAALIYEEDAVTVKIESIVAFRNAIALAVALPSWLGRGDNAQWVYSDVFDFHPATTARIGAGLMINSPALKAYWSSTSKFIGTTSPHVASITFRFGEDSYLLRVLTEEWERVFMPPGGEDSFQRALFRSLELAYAALATPVRNQSSLYDWGISLSLWVSALEILAHPRLVGKEEEVSQRDVLNLLASYKWLGERMGLRTALISFGKKKLTLRAVNLVELACHRLYDLRHRFIHGDEVTATDLRPFTDRCASLIQIAPTLYRLALRAFLSTRHPRYGADVSTLTWEQLIGRHDDLAALVLDQQLEMQVAALFEDVAEEL